MSGPVWRVHEDESVCCNECLQEIPRAMAEGTVYEGAFQPERYLCPECYHEHIHLIARSA